MTGPTCPHCHTVHPTNAARAIGRSAGPIRYWSRLGGPPRWTREDAEADWCHTTQQNGR